MGGAEPLSLEGFLAQERRLADATEAQHIHNKMLYDAVNEALLAIYKAANRVQVRTAPLLTVRVLRQYHGHGLDALRGCTLARRTRRTFHVPDACPLALGQALSCTYFLTSSLRSHGAWGVVFRCAEQHGPRRAAQPRG